MALFIGAIIEKATIGKMVTEQVDKFVLFTKGTYGIKV